MKLIQLFSVAYFKANNGTKILFKNQIFIISCITLNSNSKLPKHNIFYFQMWKAIYWSHYHQNSILSIPFQILEVVWNNKRILFTELPKCLTFNGWYNNISRGASLLSGGVTHYLPNTDRVLTQLARHQIKSHYRRFFLPLLAIYTSKTFLSSNQALYVYTKQSEMFYG